jgi:carbamoyl-phosphate synthase large subunit
MNILLSCIGRRGYIAEFFRSHLRSSDRIIGTSNTEWTPGFHSCDIGIMLPDISSAAYVPSVIRICREQKIDILLSFFDQDISVLSEHVEEFRKIGVLPLLPSKKVSDISFDKHLTHVFLMEHGFASPQTFLNLRECLDHVKRKTIKFPLVVKPRFGFASRNIFYAHNVRELKAFFYYAADMLIQEMLILPEYHFDIFNDLEGRTLAVVPKRKIAMRAGETDQAEICIAPALIEAGLRLGEELGKLGHAGPLDVDFFVDEEGKVYILEMNPRFGGAYGLSHVAGADFISLIIKIMMGEPVPPMTGDFRPGMIMMKEYKLLLGKRQDFFSAILDMRSHRADAAGKR